MDYLDIFRDGLTRLYSIPRGGVIEVCEYTSYGISRKVYWFDQDNKRLGDFSPFGTILINRRVTEDFPDRVTDYVFLHEVGHGQNGVVLHLAILVLLIVFGMLALVAAISFPSFVLFAVMQAPTVELFLLYVAVALSLLPLCCFPFVVTSWIEELRADLYAISLIGGNEFRRVRSIQRSRTQKGLVEKGWYYFRYPPDRLILWIAKRRNIG